jgi:hypothetical protein
MKIQRCQIHRSKSLNNGVMAVWNSKTLNGLSSVIKQATAMNFTPLDSSRQRASFQMKIFAKFAKKYFFLIFADFWLKTSCLTRGIQRCQIHRSKSLNNGVMAVWNSKTLNGLSSVIKQATAMNFTPLDSSRQRASFQIKIFAKFAKKYFFNFRRFLAQKKLLDERNPTVPNSSL